MKIRFLLATILFAPCALFASNFPSVIDPMVTATPPGVSVSAGYVTFNNESDTDIVITEVYSPAITKIEMHQSVLKDDVASMVKQEQLVVNANDMLVLEHGGYHLMFMELNQPLNPGDTVDVIFTTSIGEMLIEMPVVKRGAMHANHGKANDSTEMAHDADKKEDHSNMKMSEQHHTEHAGDADKTTDAAMTNKMAEEKPALKDIK